MLPNHTLPPPCGDPNPDPTIVIGIPAVPVADEMLVIIGVCATGAGCTVADVVACVAPKFAVIVALPGELPLRRLEAG